MGRTPKSIRLNSIFLLVCILLVGVELFFQNEYKFVLEHVVSNGFNKSMFGYFYAKNVHLNRTWKAMEIGFLNKHHLTGDTLKVRVEGLQFFHNEYRRMPIMFDSKICDVFELNIFGMKDMLGPNGNLTKCPLKKGVYLIHDFNLDATTFPPHFLRGRCQMKISVWQGETWIAAISWFGSVEDIIRY